MNSNNSIHKSSLLILIPALIALGCSKDESTDEPLVNCPEKTETMKLKSQTLNYTQSSVVKNVWEYNSEGWEVGYKSFNSNILSIEYKNYQHDDQGNILYYERYVDQYLVNVRKRTYNESDSPISDSLLNSSGELTHYEVWEYDGNNLSNYKWIIPQPNGDEHLHLEHKNFMYDNKDNLLSYDVYRTSGHDLITTFTYDKRGRLKSKLSDRVWDDYTYEESFLYNSDCEITDKKTFIRNELRYHFTNHQYNENGSYIYREFYSDGVLNYTEEREFE